MRKIRNIIMYVLNPQNLRNKNITENNAPISDFTCRVCYNNPPVYIESVAVPHTAGRWQHKYRRVIINAVIWCKFCNCAGNQGREVEEIQSLDFSMTSWCFIYKYNQWRGANTSRVLVLIFAFSRISTFHTSFRVSYSISGLNCIQFNYCH